MALNKDFKVKNGATITQDLSVGGNAFLNALTGTNATFTKLTATEFEATSATFTKTIVTSTSALSVINNGTGPALYVRQKGANQPIAEFVDQEGGVINFADSGNLGINTALPNEKLTIAGNVSSTGFIKGLSLSATSTNNGIVSAGRDLADIFVTTASSGSVCGSGTTNFIPAWSGSTVLTDSLLSGGSNMTRTTGSLSASVAICSPAICGTTSVCSPAICGTTAICGPAICGTTSVCSPAICGTTSVCSNTLVGNSISATSTNNGIVSAGRDLADIFTTNIGDITSVTAGPGLTGGGSTGDVSLGVGFGDGITVNANTVGVNSSVVRTTGTQTIGGIKTFSNNITTSRGITAFDGLSARSTHNGFVSAGRDLADIFATSSGNVDGSGTKFKISQWNDTDTLGDSVISAIDTGITINGKVGIGTTSPSSIAQLQAVGNILSFSTDGNDRYSLAGVSAIDGNFRYAAIRFDRSNNVAKFGHYLNTGLIERGFIAITDGGNIGIGTATPNEKLTVVGDISACGDIQGTNIIGTNITGTLQTAAQPCVTSLGTLCSLTVDDITLNDSTISDGGDLTIDAGGDIILDGDGGNIKLKDNGVEYGRITNNSCNLIIHAKSNNKDMVFCGASSGNFEALRLDMSNCGAATFNSNVTVKGNISACGGLSASEAKNFFACNVGIGTTGPTTSLHVKDGSVKVEGSGTQYGFVLQRAGDDTYEFRNLGGGLTIFNSTDGRREMFFNGDGNVGIGSTSPGQKLTVSGNISACGGLSATKAPNFFACNVGINTNRPSSYLQVSALKTIDRDLAVFCGGGSSGNFDGLRVEAGNGTHLFRVNQLTYNVLMPSSGKVGIGTTAPNKKLTVAGNISACNAVQACSVSANSTNGGFVSAGRDLADIFATSSGNVDGTGTANFIPVWSDTDTIGNSIACQSSTQLTVAGSVSANGGLSATNGNVLFSCNVGIGCTSPPDLLTLKGDSKALALYDGSDRLAAKLSVESTEDGALRLYERGSSKILLNANTNAVNFINPSNGKLGIGYDFNAVNTGGGSLQIAGDVGIGTNNPNEKLTVAGNISACGSLSGASLHTTGNVCVGNILTIPAGSAGSPSLTFSSDTDTGLFNRTAGELNVAIGGSWIANFQSTGLKIYAGTGIFNRNGSAAAPSYTFSDDTDTGMFRVGANCLGFTTNGTNALTIDSSQNICASGSLSSTSLHTTDTTRGIVSAGRDLADIFCTTSNPGTVTEVVGCDGITVNNGTGCACVCVDSTVVRTTGAQTIGGTKNFCDSICVGGSIFHTGDTDTRIAFSDDLIITCVGGEEAIRADTTGVIINQPGNANDFRVEGDGDTHALFVDGSADKVGIGTSSPGQKLTVAGNISACGGLSATEGAGYFDCNVGIGTNRPESLLHVSSNSSESQLRIESDNGNGDPFLHFKLDSGSDYSMGIDDDASNNFKISRAATLGTNDIIEVDSTTANVYCNLLVGEADGTLDGSRLEVWSTNSQSPFSITNTDNSNRKVLDSAFNSNHPRFSIFNASAVETIRLETNGVSYFNGGNVGIGNTAPGQKLTVAGNISACGGLSATNGVGYFACNVGIGTTSPSKPLDVIGDIKSSASLVGNAAVVNQVTAGTAGGSILFKNNSGTNRAIITDAGDTGIGTTSPQARLQVNVANQGKFAFAIGNDSYTGGNPRHELLMLNNGSLQWYMPDDGSTPGKIEFYSRDNSDFFFTLDSDTSNVGIGNQSPTEKLTVDGNICASGALSGASLHTTDTTRGIVSAGRDLADIFCTTSNVGTVTDVVGCDGITVNNGTGCACVCVDSTVVRTSGTQCIAGAKTFSDDICVANKIIHDGDSNTFIQLANDIAVVSTGGEEHIRACNGGIIINDNGNPNDFRVEGDADTHALFVDGSADKVGIGTSAPGEKLTVSGNISANGGLSATGSAFNYFNGRVGIGTVAPEAPLHVNSTGGTLAQFHRSGTQLVTIGGSSNQGQIRFQQGSDCISTGATTGGDYRIDTGGSVGAGDNMFYVCKGGNVGIGTTTPNEKLTVAGNISANGGLSATNGNVLFTCNVAIDGGCIIGDTSTPNIKLTNAGGVEFNYGTSKLINGGSLVWQGGGVEKFRIQAAGNVGIGTSAPGDKLTVSGNISANGDICLIDGSTVRLPEGCIDMSHESTPSQCSTITSVDGNKLKLDSSFCAEVAASSQICLNAPQVIVSGSKSGGNGLAIISSATPIANNTTLHIGDSFTDCIGFTGRARNATQFFVNRDISSGAADLICFQENGTNRFVINCAGNVGIGTSSPATELHVAGDSLVTGDSTIYGNLSVTGDFTCVETTVSTTSALSVTNTGTGPALFVKQGGTQPIAHFIDSNGDDIVFADDGAIGIGTDSPSTKLEISQGADDNALKINGFDDKSGENAQLYVRNTGNTRLDATRSINIRSGDSYGGGIGSGSTSGLTFDAFNQFTFTAESPARIPLSIVGASSQTGDLFNISDDSGDDGNLLTVLSGGFVGIGATAPTAKLHLSGSMGGGIDGADKTGIRLSNRPNGETWRIASGSGGVNHSHFTIAKPGSFPALTITSSNNVGIGVNTPTEELEVCGNICASGALSGASLHITDTTRGIVSAGRDLADIFCTTSNVGTVTDVVGCDGITVNNGTGCACVCVDSTVVRTTGSQTIDGNKTFTQPAVFCNTMAMANCLMHVGDLDTSLRFDTDTIQLCTGNEERLIANNSGVVINDVGASNDFRVEGNTDTHLLFVDGSEETVGIGTSAPGVKFTVNGALSSKGICSDKGCNVSIGTCAFSSNTSGCRNVAVGCDALKCNTTACGNVAVGFFALFSNTCGGCNVALGRQAMQNNISGCFNFAGGAEALMCNTTGGDNIGINRSALCSNTTGSQNIAMGRLTMRLNTEGSHNIALGGGAMHNNICGGCNIAMGRNTMCNAVSGCHNTALGCSSLRNNYGGCFNVGVGDHTLCLNRIGSSNVAVGQQALKSNTTGGHNVAIGRLAMACNDTGCDNIALGSSSMINGTEGTCNIGIGITTLQNNEGDFNTAIGPEALLSNTTAGGNVAIGRMTLRGNTTGSCNIALGHIALCANTTGGCNIAMGRNTLSTNTSGSHNIGFGFTTLGGSGSCNVAIGHCVMALNHCRSGSVGIGPNVMRNTTTGSSNVGIGNQALFCNTTGSCNIGIGDCAGRGVNATGCENIALGSNTLENFSSGCHNTALGQRALFKNTTGSYNIGIGQNALCQNQTGGCNTALGLCSQQNQTGGSHNFSVGYRSMRDATGGSNNVALGSNAVCLNTTGTDNTGIGSNALAGNKTGTDNVALGNQSLYLANSGTNNFAAGKCSLYSNFGGCHNTAIGLGALFGNTTGCENIAIGCCNLKSNTTGCYNNAIGKFALWTNTTGCNNNSLGRSALFGNTTGDSNNAIGLQALYCNTTGSCNNAMGYQALCGNTTGSNNIALGYQAIYSSLSGVNNFAAGKCSLYSNFGGCFNAAIGCKALAGNTTGKCNIAIGAEALCSNTTGCDNTAFGKSALESSTTGSGNIAIGKSSLKENTTGNCNVGLGALTLTANICGSCNIAIGKETLKSNTCGFCNVALGGFALFCNTNGCDNVSIGQCALFSQEVACYNIAIGTKALKSLTCGCCNIAIGQEALCCNTTAKGNVGIGRSALRNNTTGKCNVALGSCTLCCNSTGSHNFAAGASALCSNDDSSGNTAIGCQALLNNTTGNFNIGIGNHALCCNTTAQCNIAMGPCSLRNNSSGSSNVALGVMTLCNNCCGNNNIALGPSAMRCATCSSNNVALGSEVLCHVSTGAHNYGIGQNALRSNTTGSQNFAVGASALICNTTGSNNVAIGVNALKDNTCGNLNTAIGCLTLFKNTEGCNNTAIGAFALCNNTTGCCNVSIGSNTMTSNTTGTRNVAIGAQILTSNTTGSCNVALGMQSLLCNVDGTHNFAAGNVTLFKNVSGSNNFAAGNVAGCGIIGGCHNFAVGSNTLQCNKYGNGNIAAGFIAGQKITGNHNIAFGQQSLQNVTTANSNIGIGCLTLFGCSDGATGGCNVSVGLGGLCSLTTGCCNIAIGCFPLACNSSGCSNIGIGTFALFGNTSGYRNVAIGDNSLRCNTEGEYNVALGYLGLTCNTTGGCNVAVGKEVMKCNDTGHSNVALGHCTMFFNVSGDHNIAIGSNAIKTGTRGCCQIALGQDALNKSCGNFNIAFGSQALKNNTTGTNNFAAGICALTDNSTGNQNIALGNIALFNNTSGISNIAIGGSEALRCNTTGNYNIALGAAAMAGNTCGCCSLALGLNAGRCTASSVVTEACNSIALGTRSRFCTTTPTNEIVIGVDACGIGDNTVTLGNDCITTTALKGCVGIGTTSPGEKLTVTGNISASGNGIFACVIAGGYFEEKAANKKLANYETGSLVSIGDDGELTLSTVENDRRVFGVAQKGACQPIVLGAEPVLITGEVSIGDYITTSSKPGHGKKAEYTLHGTVIAQAMEAGCGSSHVVKAMIRKM